jgi:hypothetical protein
MPSALHFGFLEEKCFLHSWPDQKYFRWISLPLNVPRQQEDFKISKRQIYKLCNRYTRAFVPKSFLIASPNPKLLWEIRGVGNGASELLPQALLLTLSLHTFLQLPNFEIFFHPSTKRQIVHIHLKTSTKLFDWCTNPFHTSSKQLASSFTRYLLDIPHSLPWISKTQQQEHQRVEDWGVNPPQFWLFFAFVS